MRVIDAARVFPCALVAVLLLIGSAPARAQDADPREAAVLAVVQKLFDAMRTRDTTALRSVFEPSARLAGAVTRDGRTTIRYTTVDQFVTSIAGAPPGSVLDERTYAPEVRIDANLATVWTFYTFHVGDRFSHCGIDAFQMLETQDGWKIVALSDTRRTQNCDPPKDS